MLDQAADDAAATGLDSFAEFFCIGFAGFYRPLRLDALLERVITGIGDLFLMIEKTLHRLLSASLALAAELFHVDATGRIPFLRP